MEYKYPTAGLSRYIWAIKPEFLETLQKSLEANISISSQELALSRQGNKKSASGIGVIDIFGIISNHSDIFEWFGLGTSLDTIGEGLNLFVNDASIGTIILNVDSPGGTVDGITEMSAKIFAARKKKNIIAVANSMATSAAYWLASSAS